MESFASYELTLKKSVKKDDRVNLLELFSASDRFKPARVLADAEENDSVRVSLEGLGEIDLKLGDDMEKGQKKTIMTLFWFEERSKPINMPKDAQEGEPVKIEMQKL